MNESVVTDDIEGRAPSFRTLRSRIVSGSLILLFGSGLAGVTNLVYNIAIARLLGPTGFGHATAIYTLLTLMSAVTLSFQIVCAKLVANHDSVEEKAAIYSRLHHKAWRIGIAIGLLLTAGSKGVAWYLNLPNSTLIVLLAVGITFYVPLGVRRGWMQGTYAFPLLAINLIVEGMTRLFGALLLIQLGWGVNGAVLACVSGVMVSYVFSHPDRNATLATRLIVPTPFREGLQAIVFFSGQVVINNFDILLVKHFFPSEEAGLYAAVALVGRFVNMCAWSVVSTMFPVSAGTRGTDQHGRKVLIMSLLMVVLIIGTVTFAVSMIPNFLWTAIFGAQFKSTTYGTLSSLLTLYAVTTGVYCLSSVIITYEMSRKIANTGWLQLAASGALVLGIYVFHGSLVQVILVQLVMMTLLLAFVLLPFLPLRAFSPSAYSVPTGYGKLRKRSRLSEERIIAEFLKNEFHHAEFKDYREKFEHLVRSPDLDRTEDNDLRRALLFLRRGAMWRELPADTQWFEIALTSGDLDRIRVFPRAQWRRFAQAGFCVPDIVERIRKESVSHPHDEFLDQLQALGERVREEVVNPTILLIGVNERQPLTILDGNHRMAAAMLTAPSAVFQNFRFICGFSNRMTECCWYQTNVTTLWRYAKNLLRNLPHDPESDVGRFLHDSSQES